MSEMIEMADWDTETAINILHYSISILYRFKKLKENGKMIKEEMEEKAQRETSKCEKNVIFVL